MSTIPQTLKEIVSTNNNITSSATFFGLITRLMYQPTESRLRFVDRYYGPTLCEPLLHIFSMSDQSLEKQIVHKSHYEQNCNGKMLLECCVSDDKEFVAMRLCEFDKIDYLPITEVRFLQGSLAKQVAHFFEL